MTSCEEKGMRLECPSCKSELEVPEALMGRGIDCPVCKTRDRKSVV